MPQTCILTSRGRSVQVASALRLKTPDRGGHRHCSLGAHPPVTSAAMLRQSGRALKLPRAARGLQTQARTTSVNGRTLLVASTAAVTAGAVWYSSRETIHNDAPPAITTVADSSQKSPASVVQFPNNAEKLETLVWGSNKCVSSFLLCLLVISSFDEHYRSHVLSISEDVEQSIRSPAVANWLENVALRELVLHERHAACVDARGDVYQWGDGFQSQPGSSSGKPIRTLRGKVRIRYYCMSAAVSDIARSAEHCPSPAHVDMCVCTVCIRAHICAFLVIGGAGSPPWYADSRELAVVGYGMAMGRGGRQGLRCHHTRRETWMGGEVSCHPFSSNITKAHVL